jgi:hypothetical protein
VGVRSDDGRAGALRRCGGPGDGLGYGVTAEEFGTSDVVPMLDGGGGSEDGRGAVWFLVLVFAM